MIDGLVISSELALRWMSLHLTDGKSTLVQVMAWCRQATSHYLSQCWPRSLWPYGVTRPQWVNSWPNDAIWHHKTVIIGSGNGLSPVRRQAITWNNVDSLLIWLLGTNFSEIRIKYNHFHSRNCIWKHGLQRWAILFRPQCVNPFLPEPRMWQSHKWLI